MFKIYSNFNDNDLRFNIEDVKDVNLKDLTPIDTTKYKFKNKKGRNVLIHVLSEARDYDDSNNDL